MTSRSFPTQKTNNVQLFGLKGWKLCIIVDQICWYIFINLLELALKQHLNNDYFWDHEDDFQQTRLFSIQDILTYAT